MNKLKEILTIPDNKLDRKYFLILVLVAFIFSIGVRYIWVNDFNTVEQFKWNNELMINTNDGYYWAEGARDILAGHHQENDLSPVLTPAAELTAFLAKMIPISFETLILWLPGVLGSLLVLPIMLIARLLRQDLLGFFAAMLGAIAWSYYNRTMIGYYDTDMLIIVLPTLTLWAVMYALKRDSSLAMLLAPVFAITSMYWHAGTTNVIIGTFLITFFYMIIFERKNLYYYKFLAVFVLVLTTLAIWLKLLLIVALILIFMLAKEKLTDKIVIGITIVSFMIYIIFGGFEWIIGILHNAYLTRGLVASELDVASLKFFGVVNTVREAGHIPFEIFANRISGSVFGFWLSTLGYVLLLVRYRLMLLTLPMVLLGFFALQGGLRFTVFAVPFMALGGIFLIFVIAKYIAAFFNEKSKKYAQYGVIIVFASMIIYPNIQHVQAYKVPTVFNKEEVKVLSKLGEIASREDYVVSWWDYGYPIRYYADVKTLVDGGKHSGEVNFPVAFELTNNQVAAANMARLDVEFTEKSFKEPCGAPIECMLKAYKVKNPNQFLQTLNNKNLQKPAKTRDIYFYLPNRMMNIYPTINMFSNIDLLSGKQGARPFFFMSRNFKEANNKIILSNAVSLDKKTAEVTIGSQKVKLNYFARTYYDKNGVYKADIQKIQTNQPGVSAIYMQPYHQFLIVDDKVMNSLYFRLFVLEQYDKDLFEPVILSPYAKVYKLKI